MNADIRDWVRACMPCQRAKVQRHSVPPAKPFLRTDERFAVVHIDLVGPLPPCQGFRYILTCVDRFTRWPEACPIPDITASTIASAFVSTWVSRYGCPSTVVTDRGRQFDSSLFTELLHLLGTTRLRPAPGLTFLLQVRPVDHRRWYSPAVAGRTDAFAHVDSSVRESQPINVVELEPAAAAVAAAR